VTVSAQPFLLAQPLDGLELHQRSLILRPAEVPLDANQVVETDHAYRAARELNRLRPLQQVLVRTDRLQVREQVERVFAVDLERVVLTQREAAGVDVELEVGGRAPEREPQRPEYGGEPLEVLRPISASACPPTTMNSTPAAPSNAQKRSSGLTSGLLPNPRHS
jgi:hypothetical protein